MMKNLLIFLVALAGVFQADASLIWFETVHDFGTIKEEEGKVKCTFEFINDGTEEVSIRSARASCGCTTPAFTRDPIAPGDTGVVTVRFNPAGRPGRFSKRITLDVVGTKDNPRHTLVVKGVVIGSSATLCSRYPVEVGNARIRTTLLPFGSVLKGRTKSAFLEIYNASEMPLNPQWEGVPKFIRIVDTDNSAISPGEQKIYTFVMTPDESALYGIVADSVMLHLPETAPQRIDITALIEEDFSRLTPGPRAKVPVIAVESNRLNFGSISRSGGAVTQSFTIKNNGKSDLLMRRVYTLDKGVTIVDAPEKIKKGKKGTVTISVNPLDLPGDILNARIQIIANDPENPLSVVRAVGEVKE